MTIENRIPNYFPLHESSINPLEKHQPDSATSTAITESIKTLLDTTKTYLLNILPEKPSDEIQEATFATMRKLKKAQQNLKAYEAGLAQTKGIVRNRSREEEALNFDTLEHYSDVDNPSISKILNQQIKQNISERGDSLDEQEQFLKNCFFVINNPTTPLPDETQNDDLVVEGGQISLLDPITMLRFEDPVHSRKCGHVYERKVVLDMLRDVHKCPVSGCDAIINSNDLADDFLMKLRCCAETVKDHGDIDIL